MDDPVPMTDPASHQAAASPSKDGLVQACIALAIADQGNRDQLARYLRPAYTVVDFANVGADGFDLLLADPVSLNWHQAAIHAAKAAQTFLPVILIARDKQAQGVAALGQGVDDILRIPVLRQELDARVANMLRLRRYSHYHADRAAFAESAYAGVSRAFRTLMRCNEALVWARAEGALLDEVCRIVVEEGGYRFAWIGFINDGDTGKDLDVAGQAGDERGDLDATWPSLTEREASDGPFFTAVLSGQPCVVQDARHETRFDTWREAALARACNAMVAMPLWVEGEIAGALSIYTAEHDRFDDTELDLLRRLTDNLGYGITALRTHVARRRNEIELRRLAYYDALTGLPNRSYLLETMEDFVTTADETQAAAVLFIDLDGFKLANDAMGHEYGDELLRQVARRLRHHVREADLLARQGGDEFILFMPCAPRDGVLDAGIAEDQRSEVTRVAQRLISAVSTSFKVGGQDHQVGASVGISMYPFDATTAGELVDQADNAMYAAKSESGNTFAFYNQDLAERRSRRLELENGLRRAIEQEQFTLTYQPVIDAASGRTVAMEALVRWSRAAGDVVSPGEFLDVADETGLIVPIGHWVLDQACADLARWHAAGYEVSVAINVSIRQLAEGDVATTLRAASQAHGVSPAHVLVEVTEEAMSRDGPAVERALRHLHELGFQLAIDDFGTGYSSLGRLRDLPLSILKIDKCFVFDAPNDASDAAIVRAVVELARSLGLHVIAEGVETAEHAAFLEGVGCGCVQGFHYSRPMAAPDADAWLADARLASGRPGDE